MRKLNQLDRIEKKLDWINISIVMSFFGLSSAICGVLWYMSKLQAISFSYIKESNIAFQFEFIAEVFNITSGFFCLVMILIFISSLIVFYFKYRKRRFKNERSDNVV